MLLPHCDQCGDWDLPESHSWILVRESDDLHFCSWECVKVYATAECPDTERTNGFGFTPILG